MQATRHRPIDFLGEISRCPEILEKTSLGGFFIVHLHGKGWSGDKSIVDGGLGILDSGHLGQVFLLVLPDFGFSRDGK